MHRRRVTIASAPSDPQPASPAIPSHPQPSPAIPSHPQRSPASPVPVSAPSDRVTASATPITPCDSWRAVHHITIN
eukprot:5796510-Prymnesium_polylepis.1